MISLQRQKDKGGPVSCLKTGETSFRDDIRGLPAASTQKPLLGGGGAARPSQGPGVGREPPKPYGGGWGRGPTPLPVFPILWPEFTSAPKEFFCARCCPPPPRRGCHLPARPFPCRPHPPIQGCGGPSPPINTCARRPPAVRGPPLVGPAGPVARRGAGVPAGWLRPRRPPGGDAQHPAAGGLPLPGLAWLVLGGGGEGVTEAARYQTSADFPRIFLKKNIGAN